MIANLPAASTNPATARWLEAKGPAGSPQRVFAFHAEMRGFLSRRSSLVAKPRDALLPRRHPKRLKSGLKARNHGTHPKRVPCSKAL